MEGFEIDGSLVSSLILAITSGFTTEPEIEDLFPSFGVKDLFNDSFDILFVEFSSDTSMLDGLFPSSLSSYCVLL